MDLILLPGSNPSNEEWIKKIEFNLKSNFDSTTIQSYDHWEGIAESFDMESELGKLKENIKGKNKYAIFAKSIGTVLSIEALTRGVISPQYFIFVGTPINWQLYNKFNATKIKESLTMPVLFIQQKMDKHLHYDELEHFVKNMNLTKYKLIEVEGSDHAYSNIDELKREIALFISENKLGS